MKPNFALSLSFEGISLLHRAFPGWNRVGEVALDSPDLAGALAVLRETAQQINGHDIFCKIVIPNDQIKYLSLELGILSEEERGTAIRMALEGATPYPVDDLKFDWSVEGNQTLVAAVARETLTEAESFAESHGFGPLCFVAIPPEGQFSGEPFFGTADHASEILKDGEQVQRDMAAIRVTGLVRLPDPGDAEEDGTEAPVEHVADAAADIPDEIAAEDPAAPTGADEQEPDQPPESDDLHAIEEEPEPEEGPEPEELPEPIPVFGHAPSDTDEAGDGDAEDAAAAETDAAPEPEPFQADAAVLADTLPSESDTEADAIEPDDDEDVDPEASAEDPAPAFASMRAHRDDDADSAAPSLSGVRRGGEELTAPAIPIPLPDNLGEPAAPTAATTPEDYNDAPDDVPPMPAYMREPDDEDAPAPDEADTGEPVADLPEAPDEPRPAFLDRTDPETAAGLAASLTAQNPADHEDERQRMTVFGARKPARPNAEIGGKPRHLGLILSVVLILFLAGVAAWASLFVDDGLSRFFSSQPETDVAALPAEAVDELVVEGEEAMVPTPPEAETGDDAVELAALTAEPEPEDTLPPALVQPTLPHALSEKEAQARYAVTGVWQRAPQSPQLPDQLALDDLYVTSIDPATAAQDAVALPALDALATDVAMGRVALPAARGSRFQLDDRGLVVARAEGTLSPEGFLVFAGRPQVWPAALPQRLSADESATSEDLERLAGVRPKPRPEGLIEQNERQNLGGLTRAELGKKRPKLRPPSATEQAEAEQRAQTAAAAAEAADSVVAEVVAAEAAQAKGTEFAVAESRKPRPRPSNFARLVERTRETQNTTEPQETTRVAAAVPRSQVTAPSAPSKASVAKAATVRNQINLRKINLIGVYGKPSSRRALVRLSNGRYKKVKVGDRLDGGRVQAISDTELRYTKNGRNVTLKMPRG